MYCQAIFKLNNIVKHILLERCYLFEISIAAMNTTVFMIDFHVVPSCRLVDLPWLKNNFFTTTTTFA